MLERKRCENVNDFNEAILKLKVHPGLENAYKKAIEEENGTQWKQNSIFNNDMKMVSNELVPVWSGNYAFVEIGSDSALTISIVSHTRPNLEKTVDWYIEMGAELLYKNYRKDEKQNSPYFDIGGQTAMYC